MNVYLYYLIVLDNYNAVTYGFKISSQLDESSASAFFVIIISVQYV